VDVDSNLRKDHTISVDIRVHRSTHNSPLLSAPSSVLVVKLVELFARL
jgi:hypothetical protein